MTASKKSAEDLSEGEILRLLSEKHRSTRRERLERFRRTGRAVVLVSNDKSPLLEDLRTDTIPDDNRNRGIAPQLQGKRIVAAGLMVIEVAIIAGVAFALIYSLGLLREINRDFAAKLELPTLTPTPLIRAIVLPSGHTPPTSLGGARPNDAEIPEHLRPLVQSLAHIPTPTPSPGYGIRIQIPAISVDASIVQGDGWEQLKNGVAQHAGTTNPGQNGNMVLSAHNDIFGEIFRDLDQLETGDEIIVYTTQRAYTYVVANWRIVEPTEVNVMEPTPDVTATLISCYPYLIDTQRIVVRAKLVAN